MRFHNSQARDSSLQKLSRINRWLIAASVALTALFAEAAAHAFPGKRADNSHVHAGHTGSAKGRHRAAAHHRAKAHKSLSPPARAPSANESAPPAESGDTSGTTPTTEAAPHGEEAPSATPAPAEAEPQASSASTREAAPAPAAEAPVVSGGS